MTVSFVSTPYLGTAMLPAVNQAEAQLTSLSTESTTGEYANLGLQLGDQSGYELSLRNVDDLLGSITTANSIVNGRLSAASTALSSISSAAQKTLSSLEVWTPGSSATATLKSTGDDALQQLIYDANSSYADDYVFGGINSSAAPMSAFTSTSASQTALANAFTAQFGFPPTSASVSTISASAMQSFLNGAFDDQFVGSNWTSNWSSASSVNTSSEVAPGETTETSTNLNAGGFNELAQGYAMLAMFGGGQLSSSADEAVVSTAMNLITKGVSGITNVAAGVGQIQDVVKQADDDMLSQQTLLKTQIGGLDNVSQAQVATELNTLSTALETAYQLTAQLQKLSLAQYLPT
jgi:flagellar hook-associated protein 3 FlgL